MVVVGGIGIGVRSVLAYLFLLANNFVRGGAVTYFGGGNSVWMLSGVIFI